MSRQAVLAVHPDAEVELREAGHFVLEWRGDPVSRRRARLGSGEDEAAAWADAAKNLQEEARVNSRARN
jgi:hypothetical protein